MIVKREQLAEYLCGSFFHGFASVAAERVVKEGVMESLYELSVSYDNSLPLRARELLSFRSAYVMEYIFFHYSSLFAPYSQRFVDDFPLCKGQGARRHFGKIMCHLLPFVELTDGQASAIAEAAAEWVIARETKSGVKVWAVEILKTLRSRVDWVSLQWEDLLSVVTSEGEGKEPPPSIASRMRRSWND